MYRIISGMTEREFRMLIESNPSFKRSSSFRSGLCARDGYHRPAHFAQTGSPGKVDWYICDVCGYVETVRMPHGPLRAIQSPVGYIDAENPYKALVPLVHLLT